jgi:gas vesicle protein GvpL/GvpF
VSLVYVYAVLPRPLAADVKGIAGQRVRYIEEDELAAAVSDVPAEEFDEEPLNDNVRNMAWLGPRAVAHQEVNARLHDESEAIVPLAFGSVFRDDDRVRQLLRDEHEALSQRLETVRGNAEWVLALHLMREPDEKAVASASPAIQAMRQEITASAPGRAHLLRRQLATLERDESRRLRADAAAQLLETLKAVTADVFVEPLPTDTVERPLLRASLLVPRRDEADFLDHVDELRARWPEPIYRLLLTGPWPPYRFGGLERRDA